MPVRSAKLSAGPYPDKSAAVFHLIEAHCFAYAAIQELREVPSQGFDGMIKLQIAFCEGCLGTAGVIVQAFDLAQTDCGVRLSEEIAEFERARRIWGI